MWHVHEVVESAIACNSNCINIVSIAVWHWFGIRCNSYWFHNFRINWFNFVTYNLSHRFSSRRSTRAKSCSVHGIHGHPTVTRQESVCFKGMSYRILAKRRKQLEDLRSRICVVLLCFGLYLLRTFTTKSKWSHISSRFSFAFDLRRASLGMPPPKERQTLQGRRTLSSSPCRSRGATLPVAKRFWDPKFWMKVWWTNIIIGTKNHFQIQFRSFIVLFFMST